MTTSLCYDDSNTQGARPMSLGCGFVATGDQVGVSPQGGEHARSGAAMAGVPALALEVRA
ncbi:hypothetical protein Q4543_09705 [Salipiger sp. 1_MG-2023]|uniref:hypothetical protein n=1 Tax=Salipiger sp. 1_MG-2023 TaxID=3062665 RepID=UPI0026E30BE4|nr:hypothetical protein [Salipiger sp. 1_MG-2023]MDO6585796.1 hypothetical protein [Salipiger sp. 1_MG-2023]